MSGRYNYCSWPGPYSCRGVMVAVTRGACLYMISFLESIFLNSDSSALQVVMLSTVQRIKSGAVEGNIFTNGWPKFSSLVLQCRSKELVNRSIYNYVGIYSLLYR